uniref:Uncharacterized protein n=1 Tax=Tanacetum cinerariifolium TaxID=118510 RepID=A0A6L2MWZ3_TANCI|nr:hypothetical protein [Tanacetum cinerariifolium]
MEMYERSLHVHVDVGVEAYDSYKKENFTLCAALLWTINDFPAYSMLSGWTGKGYNACPTCMNEMSSRYLHHSKKICYMGHRRFLPSSHQWRRDKMNFDGKVDYREPVAPKSGNEILNEIDYSLNTRKRLAFAYQLLYLLDDTVSTLRDYMHLDSNCHSFMTPGL